MIVYTQIDCRYSIRNHQIVQRSNTVLSCIQQNKRINFKMIVSLDNTSDVSISENLHLSMRGSSITSTIDFVETRPRKETLILQKFLAFY